MRSYKELLNDAANKELILKKISPEDAKAVKKCVLNIYIMVADICKKNRLTMMLAGGSCLGAVRHKGYIPWDDDLDIMMPRPDYERLIRLCEQGILGDRYVFRHPRGKEESRTMFLKIYDKNSLLLGLGGKSTRFPQGCFLDIFPIDGYSRSVVIRKIKGWTANSIRLIANMVLEAGPLSVEQKQFYESNQELAQIMRLRRLFGQVFSVISHRRWVRLFDWLVRNEDMSGLVGLPTGRKLYNGEVFSADVYLPPAKATFEGMEVNIPADYDKYLTNLYHNYMELPPEEKRESHFVVSVEIPKEYYEKTENNTRYDDSPVAE